MPSLFRPNESTLRAFLDRQRGRPFSYNEVGATANAPPDGYVVDRTRIALGAGERTFRAARLAIERWRQFDVGWVAVARADAPLEAGQEVAVTARGGGLWWINGCRIAYVVDEQCAEHSRFGFAYGTLHEHVEMGEERFLVERRKAEDRVYYEILAFSRPHYWAARVGYAWVRRLQRRFARDSCRAMKAAVAELESAC